LKTHTRYTERTYRRRTRSKGMVSFGVTVKETDLWVSACRHLEKETLDLVLDCRVQLEDYARSHPAFLTSLSPLEMDPYAPPLVQEMMQATRPFGVGPMASVAGAIAQHVGKGLLKFSGQVIVENGGDIFLQADHPVTVSIFAGSSPLSERFGLLIHVRQMPLGVCSSSGSVGHSLSMGISDVVCMVSPSATVADAAATALGNRIKEKADLQRIGSWAKAMEGILGGVVIVKNSMATWGDVELVELV